MPIIMKPRNESSLLIIIYIDYIFVLDTKDRE